MIKTIIYITGPQGSGKSLLARNLESAEEFELMTFSNFMEDIISVKKLIDESKKDYIILTCNVYDGRLDKALRGLCPIYKVIYISATTHN